MKYRIAENIIFDTESEWVACRDGDTVVMEKKLTKTAAQILTILLANYGELVERDYLLSEVWETRGRHGSSSSLNQYISILRKTLCEFGVPKECIVSEPKKGFIFSRAVTVCELLTPEHYVSNDEPQSEILPSLIVSSSEESIPVLRRFRSEIKGLINITIWVLVFFAIIACFFEINKILSVKRLPDPVQLFSIKQCEAYTNSDKYTAYRMIMKEIIYDIYPDIEKKCASINMLIYIKVQPSIFFGHTGRVLLALCAGKENGEELTYCENNYRYMYSLHQEKQ